MKIITPSPLVGKKVTCNRCGIVFELKDEDMKGIDWENASNHGYIQCPTCKNSCDVGEKQ